MSTGSHPIVSSREHHHAAAADARTNRGTDFFNMFYLPSSSQSYDEDVHLSTSTYTPFQGAATAATAMVGGILNAIDTAIAVLNEEFDSSTSESVISDDTRRENLDGMHDSMESIVENESSVMRCCRKSRSKMQAATSSPVHSSTNKDHDACGNGLKQSVKHPGKRILYTAIELQFYIAHAKVYISCILSYDMHLTNICCCL